MIRKAVILAAGSATRMQEGIEWFIKNHEELRAIRKGEKMAARFGRYPFLDYQILNLVQAGLKKINLVLKPEDQFFTRHYGKFGKSVFPEVDISYSFQPTPDGTAHAVFAAKRFVGSDRFILLNGDNHYSTQSISMLLDTKSEYSAMVAYDIEGFNRWTRNRLKSFAVVSTKDGALSRIVEKAPNPDTYVVNDSLYTKGNARVRVSGSVLTSMNLWCFTPDILEACGAVPQHAPRRPGKAGEYELPDAVELLMRHGREVLVYYACEDVLDLTGAEDVKIVGRSIRKNLTRKINQLESRYTGAGSRPS